MNTRDTPKQENTIPTDEDWPLDRLLLPTLATTTAREPWRYKSAVDALASRPVVQILAQSANFQLPSERPLALLRFARVIIFSTSKLISSQFIKSISLVVQTLSSSSNCCVGWWGINKSSLVTIWEHIASSQIVTSDDLGPVTIWVFKALTQFRNWTSSFETGHPVSKLESIFASSFETGRHK